MFNSRKWSATQNQDFGVVTYVGPSKAFTPSAHLIEFNDKELRENPVDPERIEEPDPGRETVRWVRVKGVHDVALVRAVGKRTNVPDQVLEDVADTRQRPKYQELDDGFMVVLKLIDYDPEKNKLKLEQVGLGIVHHTVVTFQENETNDWDGLLARLRKGRHLSKTDPHYLFFSLMDSVIDRYMLTIGTLGDRAEALEGKLMDMQSEETLFNIYGMKRETAFLRKYLWPLREVLQFMSHKKKSKHITDYAKAYLDEVTDHTTMVIEMVDTLDKLITNMLDVYSSVSDMRMNRVMKILTVFGTIFLPLTFITGVYGMNFENMPELKWRWGYYIVITVMLMLVGSMLAWFKKKRWL